MELNVTCKTIKILEKKFNFCPLGLGKEFLDLTPKANSTKKKKTNKLDLIKTKNLVSYRLGVIFANHISNKGLVSTIYKELLNLNTYTHTKFHYKKAKNIDISLKKIYRWQISTSKCVRHHYLYRNMN